MPHRRSRVTDPRAARIQAVAFDYGNVLSRPQPHAAIEHLAGLSHLPVPEFTERYWKHRPAYDRGALTAAKYWAQVVGDPAVLDPQVLGEIVRVDVASWLLLDSVVIEWAEKLKASGLKLAILSNMPADVLDGLRSAQREWLSSFDATVFSCECGSAKPDSSIYEHLIETIATRRSAILFIDDRQANVTAASRLGLQALCYKSFESLMDQVQTEWPALSI